MTVESYLCATVIKLQDELKPPPTGSYSKSGSELCLRFWGSPCEESEYEVVSYKIYNKLAINLIFVAKTNKVTKKTFP